jgi:pyruvate dehydrogenase phosphatase
MFRHYCRRFYYHRPPGNPHVPPGKINELLRQFESSWMVADSCIARIDSSTLGANQPSEDTHFQTILKNQSICVGVMDGHWTADCSRLISYALPLYIEKHITSKNYLKHAFEDLDRDVLRLPWKAIPELSGSVEAIESMDPKKKLQALVQSLPAFAGSCAVVTNIIDRDLIVAHAGDCRAIIGIHQNGKWKAKPLTLDHQPSNLRELSRLHQEHPGEEETVAFGRGPLRVLGGMMPSRGSLK